MFKFRDSLELYQIAHESENLFAMLQDYVLDSRLSRTLMNNQILIRLGVLHPLYNDSEMLKFAIDNWFLEFNPIIKNLLDVKDGYDNLDPYQNSNWEEHYGGTRLDLNTDSATFERDAARSQETEDVSTVSAYDSSEYQPQNKVNGTSIDSQSETQEKADTYTGDRTEKHNLSHKGKEGVENYSKMLEDARNAAQFDIYDWILDRLERAVCLGVY